MVERGNCRFRVATTADGNTAIWVDIFHDTAPSLKGRVVGFELLRGASADQAKKLADAMSEWIVGVVVATEEAEA
jgi:hypothetical protein